MNKTIKNIGLGFHKNSISIGIVDDGRDGEIRYYGKYQHVHVEQQGRKPSAR